MKSPIKEHNERVTFELERDLFKKLEASAIKNDRSVSSQIRVILRDYLSDSKSKED